MIDAEILVREALAAGVGAAGVGTDFPLDGRVPFVFFTVTGGTSLDPDVIDQAIVEFQCHGASKSAARDLAHSVRQALFDARTNRLHTTQGSIAHVAENVRPVPLSVGDDEPDGIRRYRANYTLRLKPLPN